MKHFLLTLAMALPLIFMGACSNDDEPSMTGTEEIMEFISGQVFSYNDLSTGDDSYHGYKHYIMFTATSSSGGTFEHECNWKDVTIDDTNRGTVYDEGRFSVADGKISISIIRGDTWYIKYFTVVGDYLLGDNGDIYQRVSGSSGGDSPTVSSHKHPLDYYQTKYNTVISTLVAEFNSFETSKAFGDTAGARRSMNEIKRLQSAAKEIRNEASRDGWTIKASPYETKSAYL